MRANEAHVARLEHVCELIEDGKAVCVEFRAFCDLPAGIRGELMEGVYLHICDGGGVDVTLPDKRINMRVGLSLANYRNIWRVWIGDPTEEARRQLKWRVRR